MEIYHQNKKLHSLLWKISKKKKGKRNKKKIDAEKLHEREIEEEMSFHQELERRLASRRKEEL